MTEPLRPMNLGGILDRGVQIFRAQPLLFLGLAAIPGLAQLGSALSAVHPRQVTYPGSGHVLLVLASYLASFAFWIAHLALQAIITAAICLAASRVNLGEAITIRSAYNAYTSKTGRLIGLTFLQGIFAFWPLIITAFIAIPMAAAGISIFWQVPVWILGSIPCIALYTRVALAFPATAMEDLTATDSMQRSARLGEGGRWRICGGLLVPMLPALILAFGSAGLLAALKTSSALLAGSPFLVAGINGVVELIVSLVFTPYSAIVLTLLYYDQRIRREGFDVERMMQTAGLDASAPAPPASPWTQLGEDWKGDA
jgi:hypothetical protein